MLFNERLNKDYKNVKTPQTDPNVRANKSDNYKLKCTFIPKI